MEGAYNKVYRARERVPREEYAFLLERLMGTVRYVSALLSFRVGRCQASVEIPAQCIRQVRGSDIGCRWKAGARALRNIKLIGQIANSSHDRSILPFARQAERCFVAILQGRRGEGVERLCHFGTLPFPPLATYSLQCPMPLLRLPIAPAAISCLELSRYSEQTGRRAELAGRAGYA